MAKAEPKIKTKKLWGTEFELVDGGLAEPDVIEHVEALSSRLEEAHKGVERQSSLIKLAEQTVMEADRLAGEITERAKSQAEQEAATLRETAEADATRLREVATADAERIRDESVARARAEAEETLASANAKATAAYETAVEAAEIEVRSRLDRADRDATSLADASRAHVANIQSEARLEAEYAVRHITQAVTESLNTHLPLVDKITVQPEPATNGTHGGQGKSSKGSGRHRSPTRGVARGERPPARRGLGRLPVDSVRRRRSAAACGRPPRVGHPHGR